MEDGLEIVSSNASIIRMTDHYPNNIVIPLHIGELPTVDIPETKVVERKEKVMGHESNCSGETYETCSSEESEGSDFELFFVKMF